MEFDKLGEFNVLYALADGMADKLNDAFHIDYGTAYLFLRRKAMETRYSRKLNNLLYPEKK